MRNTARMSRAELVKLPPTIDLVTAGQALGLGRTTMYQLAHDGELPVKTLRLGSSYRVVTADLLRVLCIDQDSTD